MNETLHWEDTLWPLQTYFHTKIFQLYVSFRTVYKIISNQFTGTLIDLQRSSFKLFMDKRIFPSNTIKFLTAGHF